MTVPITAVRRRRRARSTASTWREAGHFVQHKGLSDQVGPHRVDGQSTASLAQHVAQQHHAVGRCVLTRRSPNAMRSCSHQPVAAVASQPPCKVTQAARCSTQAFIGAAARQTVQPATLGIRHPFRKVEADQRQRSERITLHRDDPGHRPETAARFRLHRWRAFGRTSGRHPTAAAALLMPRNGAASCIAWTSRPRRSSTARNRSNGNGARGSISEAAPGPDRPRPDQSDHQPLARSAYRSSSRMRSGGSREPASPRANSSRQARSTPTEAAA